MTTPSYSLHWINVFHNAFFWEGIGFSYPQGTDRVVRKWISKWSQHHILLPHLLFMLMHLKWGKNKVHPNFLSFGSHHRPLQLVFVVMDVWLTVSCKSNSVRLAQMWQRMFTWKLSHVTFQTRGKCPPPLIFIYYVSTMIVRAPCSFYPKK